MCRERRSPAVFLEIGPNDTRDIAAGEILALSLAARAGIRLAEHRLGPVGKGVSCCTQLIRAGIAVLIASTVVGLENYLGEGLILCNLDSHQCHERDDATALAA